MTTSKTNQTLLRNARIVLSDRLPPQTNLLIRDGRIAALDGQLPDTSVSEVDLTGCTLFPGFIDLHIHGAVGVDTMDADAAGLRRISEFLASQGVTAWLPTLVPAPDADYAHAIAAIEAAMKTTGGARILGVHYEGPFVSTAQCGALRQQYFRSFVDSSALDSLPRLANPAAVHMITIAPEIAGGIELVQQLKRRGWVVSIGHTRADFEVLDKALAAGARHMTHFMNAMAPFQQRAPGPIGWGLLRDGVTCDLIADRIHLDRHALELILKNKGAQRVMLISDAIAAAGLGDGDYQIWGESISVTNGRTRNSRGSIAGSVISLLDAVGTMASLGVSEIDLARISSTNAAKLLGIDTECGAIEGGKRADLVALDSGNQPVLVMVNGEALGPRAPRPQ
ncbi:MAG TPA: N-acetylglucosamine-6-phosphate deacetylase [Pyrinomonadaceae bacterium]|nr:N-acetylglucosamine-6-phosphate deacetylase [Pyrinomonadaceae bacterium]